MNEMMLGIVLKTPEHELLEEVGIGRFLARDKISMRDEGQEASEDLFKRAIMLTQLRYVGSNLERELNGTGLLALQYNAS